MFYNYLTARIAKIGGGGGRSSGSGSLASKDSVELELGVLVVPLLRDVLCVHKVADGLGAGGVGLRELRGLVEREPDLAGVLVPDLAELVDLLGLEGGHRDGLDVVPELTTMVKIVIKKCFKKECVRFVSLFTGFHCMLGTQKFRNLCRQQRGTWQCSPCTSCCRGAGGAHEGSSGYARLALLSTTFFVGGGGDVVIGGVVKVKNIYERKLVFFSFFLLFLFSFS